MRVSFLGQGFTENSPNSVGIHLNKYLADKSYNTFFAISAFASPLGVRLFNSFKAVKESLDILNNVVRVD